MGESNTAVAAYVRNETVQKRIEELLGNRTGQITTSLLTAVNANEKLAQCKPETVLNAALTAASMDLPINSNLGFAYIIPYNDVAQFQIGWKGFIQLAQRSGFYKTINASDVREGELKIRDRLTGEIEFEWIEDETERDKKDVIGYVSYFKLLSGFEKSLYMTVEKVEKHALKYSKSYAYDKQKNYKSSKWTTDFDAMARKTVIKLLISKYGPMSTQLQEAIEKDQSVIKDDSIEYIDNDNDKEIKSRSLNKWIPSDDRPMSEFQKETLDNLFRQMRIENDDDKNNWLWDNYGVGMKDLTEAQAHQVNSDITLDIKHEDTIPDQSHHGTRKDNKNDL